MKQSPGHDLWRTLAARLEAGTAVAAATIATADGSTPRSAGAKLLADASGLVSGTLGGGAAEARAIDEAQKTLADGKRRLFEIDMSGAASSGADLICGGTARIFVERIGPDQAPLYKRLTARLDAGQDSFLLTPLSGDAPARIIEQESPAPEFAPLFEDGAGGAQLTVHDGIECFWEPVKAMLRLILVGGGHVSLATARMASLVDFDVLVMDDRAEFASRDRFPWLPAERLKVVPEYRDCLSEAALGFPVTASCFVAIMTRGHSHDGAVLEMALRTPAGYIGMIGSRRKRDALYANLLNQGFTENDLERIHSPIGLPIGGETPPEIAVSILAELISVRAGGVWKT